MDKIKKKLEEEDKVRDELLSTQRRTIRICSEAIKSIHRKEFEESDKKITDAAKNIKHMSLIVKGLASLECWRGDVLPSVDECQITWKSYMLAHCDVIGELRRYLLDSLKNRDFVNAQRAFEYMEYLRYLLDSLKNRDFVNAQRAFEYMEYLYSELMTVDYTKMLVGSLRSRNLVNRSRTDLINAMQAFELKESMETLTEKLDNFKKTIDKHE